MSEQPQKAIERHFNSIEKAIIEYEFFFAISEYVEFIKNHSPFSDLAAKLEKESNLNEEAQSSWKERIDWFSFPKSTVEMWEKMLFVHRIVKRGKKLTEELELIPSKREEWIEIKSAVSELSDLENSKERDILRRPFFRSQVYRAGLNAIHDYFLQLNTRGPDSTNNTEQHYVYKKNNEYFYRDLRLDFTRESLSGRVFEVIYHNHDEEGFISYRRIEEKLRELGFPHYEGQKSITRIQNALNHHQGFFRYAKVNGQPLNQFLPDGRRLIAFKRGLGVQFNNLKQN